MSDLILAATHIELSWLTELLKARQDKPLLDFPLYRADKVLFVVSGPGMANAAAAAAVAIERFRPERIFSTGICGCYMEDATLLGTAVIGTQAIFADTGAAGPVTFISLETMGLPLCKTARGTIYNGIFLDDSPGPATVPRTQFLTISSVSDSHAAAKKLCLRFPSAEGLLRCEDMESAAIALIAFRSGIPCTVVRGISNICGQRDRAAWKITEAAQAAQEALYSMLQK